MRLRQLAITRYGKFTDRVLDFGPKKTGQADFHIIYGPNEAGKSTALSAYMDLIFGIDSRSSYNFLHDYKSMLIGGTVETAEDTLTFKRTKGTKDTLRDDNGNLIDPARLNTLLHGLDRDAYGTMFSLDGARLESGGEDILANKGELGRLLFSAASGMADIGSTLDTLKGKADAFFAPKKRKHELTDLIGQLKALDAKRKEMDTQAGEFERLRETLAAAKEHRDSVQAERTQLTREKDRLESLKSAFPLAQELTELTANEQSLSSYPPLDDPSLLDEIPKLRDAITEARTMEQAATQEIERIDANLAEQPTDSEALSLADKTADLEDLRSRYQSGRNDLERVRQEKDEADAAIQINVVALGADDNAPLEMLIQPVDKIALLSELIKEHAILTAKLDTASQEKADADDALTKAKNETTKTDTATVNTETLEPLLRRIRNDDSVGVLTRAEEALLRAKLNTERALSSLKPWTGTAEVLLSGTAPYPDQATAWRDKIRNLNEDRTILAKRKAQDIEERARLVAKITSITGSEGIISDAQATETRKARDTAWQKHRSALNDETADIFKAALDTDDRAQAARLDQSDRLANLRELEQNRAALDAGITAAEAEELRLDVLLQETRSQISKVLIAAGLPETFDPLGLPKWLSDREAAKSIATHEATARHDRDTAKRQIDTHLSSLRVALREATISLENDWSLERLLDTGDALVEKEKTTALTRASYEETLADARTNAGKRGASAQKAKENLSDWQARWSDTLTGTWIENRTPAEVNALLDPLRNLPAQIKSRDDIARRIVGMERDINDFEKAFNDLNADTPEDHIDDAGIRFTKLTERINTAKINMEKTATLKAARDNQETAKTQAEAKRTATLERVSEIAKRYPEDLKIQDVDSLASALHKSAERADLHVKVTSLKTALIGLLDCITLDEANAMLSETNEAITKSSLVEIESSHQQAEEKWKDAIIAHRDAENAIQSVGGDAAVARIDEERATLLLDISDKAQSSLRLRLGILAAERALYLYRDRHRSSMMSRTTNAFRNITGGTYDKLETQQNGNTERLIAIRKDTGASVGVEGMSTATRHQLFFALRLAGYEDFCERSDSLPLIADDILESFDEDRATESFKQLQALAHKGQAIYLTHHRHLCTIAEKVCGDEVSIHEL